MLARTLDASNIVALLLVAILGIEIVGLVLLLFWCLIFGAPLSLATCLALAEPVYDVVRVKELATTAASFSMSNFCAYRVPLTPTSLAALAMMLAWSATYKPLELAVTSFLDFGARTVFNVYVAGAALLTLGLWFRLKVSDSPKGLNSTMSYVTLYLFIDLFLIAYVIAAQRRLNERASMAR